MCGGTPRGQRGDLLGGRERKKEREMEGAREKKRDGERENNVLIQYILYYR